MRWLFATSVALVIAFNVVHLLSLPLVVSYDGHLYIDQASMFGTDRFARDWDFIRTPLYPFLLRVSLEVVGDQPAAIVLVSWSLGLASVLLLAFLVRSTVGPLAAAAVAIACALYPVLIAYQHCALSETGTLFFLTLLLTVGVYPVRKGARYRTSIKAALLASALVAGYYFRPTIIYIGPIIFLVFAFEVYANGSGTRRSRFRSAVLAAGIPLMTAFGMCYPWMRMTSESGRTGDHMFVALIKQAAIRPDEPIMADVRAIYERAICSSSSRGRLPVSGILGHLIIPILDPVLSKHRDEARALFTRIVRKDPRAYLKGALRTFLYLSGVRTSESENLFFTHEVFNVKNSGDNIHAGPPSLDAVIRGRFAQPGRQSSGLSQIPARLQDYYDVVILLGAILSFMGLALGAFTRSFPLLYGSVIPLSFVALHSALLSAIDRYSFPPFVFFIAATVIGAIIGLRSVGLLISRRGRARLT